MPKNLEFGIQTNGIKHAHADPMPDIHKRFHMVKETGLFDYCLLYTSPSPRDLSTSRMPSSA